jgi:Zn-finger nucleic acid-binding protein
MDCPVDKSPMIILECNGVEVDYCVHCRGVWLDAGEIELLFGSAEECAAFLTIGSPADAGDEKPRRCPVCNVKMTKEATESNPPIIFDHCPDGDGLWFDGGELARVLEHSKTLGGKVDVPEFLRDVFSDKQAKETSGNARE